MPFSLTVDTVRNVAVVLGEGRADLTAVTAMMDTVLRHPEVREDTALLVDVRALDFDPSIEEGHRIAALQSDPATFGRRRIASITRPGLQFGIARTMATLMWLRGTTSAAFLDEQEAWDWLASPGVEER